MKDHSDGIFCLVASTANILPRGSRMWFRIATVISSEDGVLHFNHHQLIVGMQRPIIVHIHLAQKVHWQFVKPALCKYPTTVNNSEIYILLPKPCPRMWHLMCGNHVRNGSDRRPETGKICSPKLALLKIPIGAALWYYHADNARIHWISTKDSDSTAVSATP